MPPAFVRVLIVGESPLARAGLAALLGSEADILVVGQAAVDDELAEAIAAHAPHALVWDMGWDPQRTLEHLAELRDSAPPVLALIADETRASDVIGAGARGVLLQDAGSETLAAALRVVALGLMVVDPQLVTMPLIAGGDQPPHPADALTARELEVLALLAEGLPNKTIAQRLSISEHTVKFHVNAVMGKLAAQSRTEAVVRATRLGLIAL